MSTGSKYQAAASAKKLDNGFHLLLAVLGLVALGWLWCNSGRTVRARNPQDHRPGPAAQPPTGVRDHGQRLQARELPPASAIPARNADAPQMAGIAKQQAIAATQLNPQPAEPKPIEPKIPFGLSQEGQRVLQAQLALVSQGISPGSIDGVFGSQTRAALNAYYQRAQRALANESSAITELGSALSQAPLTSYVVTSNDLARLLPLGKSWLGKSQQERLDYETILELVAEKTQSHPNLVRRLNPGVDWSNVVAGLSLSVPKADFPPANAKAALVKIFLEARVLQAYDQNSNLLAHFPCSIAQRLEKRPAGELRVAVVAQNPNYTFDPEIFPESAEARELDRKLILQPGPNNPVGTVWIGLDKPGYGIHGTPRPEEVGRTESHGCFRLANWNAEYLSRLVSVGMPVLIEP